MSELALRTPEPIAASRSTLLIPQTYLSQFFNPGPHKKVGDLPLAWYLSKLLNDPLLEFKLSFLKPRRWKKEYQDGGQNLVRVNFYPDERDWGRLSAISNAMGFSRCYIFVYLMLIDMGVIALNNGGTPPAKGSNTWNPVISGTISVDVITRRLTRTLQTYVPISSTHYPGRSSTTFLE